MGQDSEGDADAVSSPPRRRRRLLPSSDSLQAPTITVPGELVEEILCKLPVKPLMRFRFVCKPWNSLISSPRFAKKHLRCSPTDFTRHHLLLHSTSSRDYDYADYPLLSVLNTAMPAPTAMFKFDENGFHSIIGSCDGIVCLYADYMKSIILWNPSIQRFKILPPVKNPQEVKMYGFGYDNLSDTYKLVAVFHCKDDSLHLGHKAKAQVHTCGTDSWREIPEFPSCVPSAGKTGTFVSGALHWLAFDHDRNWFIISLDLGNECYKKILPPPIGIEGESLGVLRDCLSILSGDPEVCHVWLMKEYGNEKTWTKLFSITRQIFHYDYDIHALHISDDDELLVNFNSKLYLYNPRDNTKKTPQIQNITGGVVPGVYVESLIGL